GEGIGKGSCRLTVLCGQPAHRNDDFGSPEIDCLGVGGREPVNPHDAKDGTGRWSGPRWKAGEQSLEKEALLNGKEHQLSIQRVFGRAKELTGRSLAD